MIPSRLLDDHDTEPHAAPPALTVQQQPVVDIAERSYDVVLLAAVLGLIVIGVVEVFSSSAVLGLKRFGDSMYFVKRQLIWLVPGAGALWIGAHCEVGWLRRWTYPLLALTLFLLMAV